MRIVLTGGGSGGHFYPIIAVVQSIFDICKQQKILEPDMVFISDGPFNERMLLDNGVRFKRVATGKRRLYASAKNFTDLPKTILGCIRAVSLMFELYPDVVFSKGGYASLPTVLAARILRIPVVIHESDTVPGRVNAWAGKFAEKIAISFPEASEYFKKKDVALTGTPIRKEILTPVKTGAAEYFDLASDIPTMLVLGGSQGAQVVNEALIDALPELLKNYQIIHQAGRANFEYVTQTVSVILEKNEFKKRYKVVDYLDDLAMRHAAGAASIIVSRAGASAISEIAAWGIPCILIPIAESNADHQRQNAFAYNRAGAATVIEEANLSAHILISELERIMSSSERYDRMHQSALSFARIDAADKIARVLIDIALSHE